MIEAVAVTAIVRGCLDRFGFDLNSSDLGWYRHSQPHECSENLHRCYDFLAPSPRADLTADHHPFTLESSSKVSHPCRATSQLLRGQPGNRVYNMNPGFRPRELLIIYSTTSATAQTVDMSPKMRVISSILLWLSLPASITGDAQIPIQDKHSKKHNLTLNFDDLSTNGSGIGFKPSPSAASFSYEDLFFESFTVKNVAKALPDLDSPIDIMCASSAPNAIFGKRLPGYPWPHMSLHDLTLPFHRPRANVSFNMLSLSLSPTGNITGENGNTFAQLTILLMRLPPDPPPPGTTPAWPGLVRGQPGYSFAQHIYQIGILFGPGAHESINFSFEQWKQYIPGFGEGVDVLEMYAEVFKVNEKKRMWEVDSEWEFCVDDVRIEVVEGESSESSPYEKGHMQRLTVQRLDDGLLVPAQELGEQILKDLGRISDVGRHLNTRL